MAKKTGLGIVGATITDADGGGAHDIANDIMDYGSAQSVATYDVTGLDKFVHERLGGLQDQKIDFTLAFNPAVNRAHRLFSRAITVPRTLVLPLSPVTGGVTGVTQTLGVFISSYSVSRSATGQLQAKAGLVSQSGVVAYS